jgi:hypothetical protein
MMCVGGFSVVLLHHHFVAGSDLFRTRTIESWEERKGSPLAPSLVEFVQQGSDGQQKGIVVTDTIGAFSPSGDQNYALFARRIAPKGASLYDRKTTSSLDDTARSESCNQGVYLLSRFRRALAGRTWLFVFRSTNRTTRSHATLSAAFAAGGLLCV